MMTFGFVATAAATQTSPTVMWTFLRRIHPELIDAIQAGRPDEAYAYARLVACVATALQERRPLLQPVPVTSTWKGWRHAWRRSSR